MRDFDKGGFAELCFAAVLFAAAVWFGIDQAADGTHVAPIWPANALLLGYLLTIPLDKWPRFLAAGYCINLLFLQIFVTTSAPIATFISGCNTLETMLAGLAIYRRARTPDATLSVDFQLAFLIYAVVAAPAVAALLAASFLEQQTAVPFLETFRGWFAADALGMMIFGPLVVAFRTAQLRPLLRWPRIAETVGLCVLGTLVTALVFWQVSYPFLFLILPILLVVTFRLGLPGGTLCLCVVTMVSIGLTISWHGIFPADSASTLNARVLLTQIFLAVAMLTTVPVATVLAQRKRLETSLLRAKAELTKLASTDQLTGLPNRRRFREVLDREWGRGVREGKSIGIVVLDVDLFKNYNDTYGHAQGDECLAKVGRLLRETIFRPTDLAARYGGEEFAIILPDTDLGGALRVAERVREMVEGLGLPHRSSAIGIVTASMGVTSIVPDSHIDSRILFELADSALYRAKRGGRNRVESAGREERTRSESKPAADVQKATEMHAAVNEL